MLFHYIRNMNFSYWEKKEWLTDVDYTVIGSGIVGLSCALTLKRKCPKAKVLILEKGIMPQGASTKNAGFACFGSISELMDDLDNLSEKELVSLIEKRWMGLQKLRSLLGDDAIGYKNYQGYEVFLNKEDGFYEACVSNIERFNKMVKPLFKQDVYGLSPNKFGFKNIRENLITNRFEGQLDTGKMMHALLRMAHENNIKILNHTAVESFFSSGEHVAVKTARFHVITKNLFVATNGFAHQMGISNVTPARAQVLITRPINNLTIRGAFHLEKGFYYFRNVGDRLLFGGGRNLDIEGETTTQFGQSALIQDKLELLLKEVILPGTPFEIEHRWSGIMGVGNVKKPIVKQISSNVFCGVRLGGMGVAIGCAVGEELASLAV